MKTVVLTILLAAVCIGAGLSALWYVLMKHVTVSSELQAIGYFLFSFWIPIVFLYMVFLGKPMSLPSSNEEEPRG